MPCLDDATALAFGRGDLEPEAIDHVVEHIDGCDACRMLVAMAATAAPSARSPTESEAIPSHVGRFVVEAVAGRGAMGIVYRGRDRRLDRPVALKVIRPERLGRGSHERLEREARALAKVDHPAVVGVYEVGDLDGSVFLAMEYIDGGTLEQWLARGPHPVAAVVERFIAAGEGLWAAHQAGLVHRDFKPSNAMLDERGHVHVTDFGLVSDGAAEVGIGEGPPTGLVLTQTGVVVGTPAYMAPEQLDARSADPRSDQFSFCVALFEAVAGHRPFEAATIAGLMEAVSGGRPATPRRPIPRYLHRALLRGLAPRPADRFPSMRALLDELATPPRTGRWIAGAVLVAAAGVGGAAWMLRDPATPAVTVVEAASTEPDSTRSGSSGLGAPSPLLAEDSDCADVDARWSAVWTEPRRAGLRQFEKDHWPATPPSSVHPKLAERWEGVGRVNATLTIDEVRRFGDTWRSLYRETCTDAGDRTTSTARLRRACLVDVLQRVDALIDSPPRRKFRAALSASRDNLSRCSTHLVESLTLPKEEAQRSAEQARALLSRAAAARWGANLDAAQPLVDEALALARTAGDPPLLAEAWLEHGQVLGAAGEGERAIESLHEAIGFAQPSEHHRVFREAAEALAWWYLFGAADARQSRRWLETAGRMDGKIPPSSREKGRRKIVEAHLARLEGDAEAAVRALSSALEHELAP
ncbi:MAG: serine/threonine protein kinase, partial [Deltaproteobacteria bacterium]|nr:serine/threonine protein kinase [Deltaproteobacteria bacterium]